MKSGKFKMTIQNSKLLKVKIPSEGRHNFSF